MDDLTENLKKKMKHFWREVASGIPIVRVKCSYLKIVLDQELDGLLYLEASSDSE